MKRTTILLFTRDHRFATKLSAELSEDFHLVKCDSFYSFDQNFSIFCGGAIIDLDFLFQYQSDFPELSMEYYISKIDVPLGILSDFCSPMDMQTACREIARFPKNTLYHRENFRNLGTGTFRDLWKNHLFSASSMPTPAISFQRKSRNTQFVSPLLQTESTEKETFPAGIPAGIPVSIPAETSTNISAGVPTSIQTETPTKIPAECQTKIETEIMRNFHHQIQKAAESDEPVLILGESGSGKSWTARQIHNLSKRSQNPFISVNMSSISAELAESQLFGTAKGDFTDAVNRNGYFHETKDGTLFLDEVGELPLDVQPKLLDVIEKQTYRKLCSTKEQPFLGRLIYATNANIPKMVKDRKFRVDLFYRISVLVINVPPLRQRPTEIISLANQFAKQQGRRISKKAMDKLLHHNWPGNIRELHHVITRAAIFSDNQELQPQDLEFLQIDIPLD